MNVIITSDEPTKVNVTCDKPDVIEVVGAEPVQVTVSVTKDGNSAYQIAVLNGFVGSEQDWLNMMYNPDGGIIF